MIDAPEQSEVQTRSKDGGNAQFLLAGTLAGLRNAIAGKRSVTIEAEYGDECVEGTLATLAHHGSRSLQPPPCSYANGFVDTSQVEAVGLSHLDPDALGGCQAVLGQKPDDEKFWRLVEGYDLQGLHKVHRLGADPTTLRKLYALLAWHEDNPVFPPKDGSASTITDTVLVGNNASIHIVEKNDGELLKKGDAYQESLIALNRDSFHGYGDGVILRVHEQGTNFLYQTPDGEIAKSVVAFKPSKGKITISFADAPTGMNAIQIAQHLWGDEAGGHAGIAGSPRGKAMNMQDAQIAFEFVKKA